MATPPRPLLLRREDFRGADAPWVGRLFQVLNDHFAAVTTALNAGLTREQNSRSVVEIVTLRGDASPVTLKHDLVTRPTDVWVGRLIRTDGGEITGPWAMTWSHGSTDGTILVSFQGLTAGVQYEARVLLE